MSTLALLALVLLLINGVADDKEMKHTSLAAFIGLFAVGMLMALDIIRALVGLLS